MSSKVKKERTNAPLERVELPRVRPPWIFCDAARTWPQDWRAVPRDRRNLAGRQGRSAAGLHHARIRNSASSNEATTVGDLTVTATPGQHGVHVDALQRQTDLVLGRPGARVLIGAVVAN